MERTKNTYEVKKTGIRTLVTKRTEGSLGSKWSRQPPVLHHTHLPSHSKIRGRYSISCQPERNYTPHRPPIQTAIILYRYINHYIIIFVYTYHFINSIIYTLPLCTPLHKHSPEALMLVRQEKPVLSRPTLVNLILEGFLHRNIRTTPNDTFPLNTNAQRTVCTILRYDEH